MTGGRNLTHGLSPNRPTLSSTQHSPVVEVGGVCKPIATIVLGRVGFQATPTRTGTNCLVLAPEGERERGFRHYRAVTSSVVECSILVRDMAIKLFFNSNNTVVEVVGRGRWMGGRMDG